ncbi:MAG TPA: Trk system potassium transporter TrkA [Candidatus Hydrogenedens sp.]|nr:Trk system potassium transporter TrkA [Candidatus Hydrogenedens sp.]HOK09922.1 Trk system potassium transporter TrkA [Candidatus Hydrogenedens sp.]HOL19643.1 Trk system potassium transporter TrkA [Candidatus Hydrogenedens sp.]HPP57710.1 Trk system potassium transporter TrkA [Candidatus Hydrogenedens sp.]
MKIVIAGAGRAGSLLAEMLYKDNDVTVIDYDKSVLDDLTGRVDVGTRLGNAQDPSLIQEVISGGCDLFIATLGDDRANIIASSCAKNLGAVSVSALISDMVYINNAFLYESILGIDYFLSPDQLAATDIASFTESPGLLVSEEYGNDRIQFYELRVWNQFKESGKTLKEVMDVIREKLVVGYIKSGKQVDVPTGETQIKCGDILGIFGKRDGIARAVKVFTGDWDKKKRVIILGGTPITVQIIRALKDKVSVIKLFEKDKQRAEELSQILSKYKMDIINDDPLSNRSQLIAVKDFDVFIAPTHDDERNVVAASLAKDIGIPYVVSVIYNKQFGELVDRFGIDYSVIPYYSFVNKVLRIVYQNTVKHLLNIRGIEIAEYEIKKSFKFLNRALKDIRFDIGCVVAGIIREEQPIIPTGTDVIKEGDRVVIVTKAEKFNDVSKLFK